MPTAPKLISVSQACELIGLGRTKLYELLATRRLDSVAIGRRRLITAESLERLIDQARVNSLNHPACKLPPDSHALYSHGNISIESIHPPIGSVEGMDAQIGPIIFSRNISDGEI